MIRELDTIILVEDLPQYGLERGDVGTVALVHGKDAGYEVEFISLDGETVAVTTLRPEQVRPSRRRELAHARELTAQAAA